VVASSHLASAHRAKILAALTSVLPTRYRDYPFQDSTRFREDLGMDSLSFLEFLVALEEALAIPVTAEMLRIQNLMSVRDVITLVDSLREGGGA
jgi:acyl carrier protein